VSENLKLNSELYFNI